MNRKRTILMALMGLEIGGAETHVVELAKELSRQGYDIAVVSNGGVYVSELEAAGIRHYHAPLHKRSPFLMLTSLFRLWRVIRAERPDVVHAHARIPAFLCGLLRPILKFPFVTSAHWVFRVSGPLKLLSDWGQRTIAVSEDIKSYLMENYGVPDDHITVTINGIDTEKFSPAVSGRKVLEEFGLDPDRPVLSYVSRMDESRALAARQLVSIAPRLRQAIPGLQLLIAGGGDAFDEIKEQAEAVNANQGCRCVVMTGPRTDINEIVAAGDLFVGVSRAALEAMAAAKPVIVAGNEGYLGLFGPDKLALAQESNFCCRGCPMCDPDTLAQDVIRILSMDGEAREALGDYGRQVIFDHYSVRRMAADCVTAYEQVWKPVQVLMSGYYGFNNLGDEAILCSIRRRLRQVDPAIQINVLSNDPQQTAQCYGVQATPRFNLWKVCRAIRQCDVLLSGGGSLLQDRTSTRSLWYYLSILRYAKHADKPVMLYANGIGPVRRPANRRLVRRVVDQADLITLREASSAEELRAMGVTNPHLHVTADPVFTIDGADREETLALLAKAGIPTDKKLLGISVRNSGGMDQAIDSFARFCDDAARKYDCVPVLLLMQPPHDEAISRHLQQAMTAPAYLFQSPYRPEHMMGVIRSMEAVISMRLHTLIFAAKQRTPLMGFVYDPKVDAILDTLGMPSCGTPLDFDAALAMERFDQLMTHQEEYRARLDEAVQRLETLALENDRLLLSLLEGQ